MTAWYEESFGQDYLTVYKHRDIQGAQAEVKRMISWLQLPSGSRILDLCCGMGRHSIALTEEGYRVTGLDLSSVLLEEARKLDSKGSVQWFQGDMRRVPEEVGGGFDAVVNLFTSFGYFETDDENRLVLSEIGRVLKPGGRFIIDYLNPAYVEAHLVPHSQREDDGTLIDERRCVSEGFVRKHITLSEPDKEDRHYQEQVKLYSLDDFLRMTAGTGLVIQQVYGNYDGSDYSAAPVDAQRLIMIGRKEAAQ